MITFNMLKPEEGFVIDNKTNKIIKGDWILPFSMDNDRLVSPSKNKEYFLRDPNIIRGSMN